MSTTTTAIPVEQSQQVDIVVEDDEGKEEEEKECNKTSQQLREKYQGVELFEKVATKSIQVKEAARSNRCHKCWHDQTLRCICHLIPPITAKTTATTEATENTTATSPTKLELPMIQTLILMHYKEYLSAGDDAKLLLTMLPENSKLYIFGREGDWQLFEEELLIDPIHTLILWPCEGALTIDEYLNQLPNDSPWKQQQQRKTNTSNADNTTTTEPSPADVSVLPTLRVVVLDGVYSHARNMFKTMKKRILQQKQSASSIKVVALHPDSISVYHRAQKSYAASSTATTLRSKDPKALHICTVEAYALLLKELGESPEVTSALVDAVQINNAALVHSIHVRPKSGMPKSKSSGASKRNQRKKEGKTTKAEEAASTTTTTNNDEQETTSN